MMNIAIKKMTCLKCQTVANVFRIKPDSTWTQGILLSTLSLVFLPEKCNQLQLF